MPACSAWVGVESMQLFSRVLVALALVAWLVAMQAAITVWRLSAPGEKFSNYFRLCSWRFAALEARLGPGIRPILSRFRLGMIIFIVCVIIALVGGVMTIGNLTS